MVPTHRPAAQGSPPQRLARMDERALPGGGRVCVASTFWQRLAGLMLLRRLPPRCGLLLEGVDSIHTAWMRFAIDVVFLDGRGLPIRTVPGLRPWRVASCRGAAAVLELAAGDAAALGYAERLSRSSPPGPSPPPSARASPGSRGACRA